MKCKNCGEELYSMWELCDKCYRKFISHPFEKAVTKVEKAYKEGVRKAVNFIFENYQVQWYNDGTPHDQAGIIKAIEEKK